MVDTRFMISITLFLTFIVLIVVMTSLRILKKIDSPFGEVSFANKITRKKIGRVLSKTFYQELTSAHAPFNWRIASALAISQLSKKDIEKFLTALDKVLKTEKDAVFKLDGVEESKLKTILNPFQKKGAVLEIEQGLIDFESYYLLENSDTTEALEYFINLEVVNFADDLKKQTRIDGGPPFNIDPPPF